MKSQKVIKEVIKTEKLPQGQAKPYTFRRNNNSNASSNIYTVKETTVEKRFKRSFNKEGSSTQSYQNTSSNLKQGTNSGNKFQNKIPVSNTEEKTTTTIVKNTTTSRNNYSEGLRYRRFKREIDKIIKIQKWWRRMLAILDGYKIRESLFDQNKQNYVVQSQKIFTETFSSEQNQNQNQPISGYLRSPQTNSYTSLYHLNNNQNSRSYTNIKNVTTNINRDLNTTRLNTSSSMNYIRTINKRIINQSSPLLVQSVSTSPSVKSKYIIETRKVEVFRKPKNLSASRFVRESNVNIVNSISNYEVKQLMKDIWNGETYCSTVESLCCLGDDVKHNAPKNTVIIEEYEEEIRQLKNMLMRKDDDLNKLMRTLNETKRELNVNITKNMRTKKYYGQKNLDQDAHELQIISMKLGWNDVNIPSPVNEIFIESIENKIPPRMQYIEGMQIMGKEKMGNMERWSQKIHTEESIQESVSDPEAVLEIQEMNALSIISNKIRPKNMCQHLQSLMILSKRNEENSEEYSVNIKEKEEKTGIEIIPIEKEPLVFQKIEQINIRSRPKPRKPKNQIQELDGLEIINYQRPKIELKRKVKPRYILQNVDKICIKSLYEKTEKIEKVEKRNLMIQELDGIEIIKAGKEPLIPQCVDELEVMREYDMLLVKPTWNSLQIQGSGLNLLALPRDMGLENQEVDEFEILGLEKPELCIQSLEKVSYEKPKASQKIQILKEPEIKVVEKVIVKDATKKIAPNEIDKNNQFTIRGRKKSDIKKMAKVDRISIKGKEKVDNSKVVMIDEILIKGKDVKNKIVKAEKFKIQGLKPRIKIIKEEKKEEKVEEVVEKEPEENVEENVVEISILNKQKKIKPNVVKILERFRINGEEKKIVPYEVEEVDGIEMLGEIEPEKVIGPYEVEEVDGIEMLGEVKEIGPYEVEEVDGIELLGELERAIMSYEVEAVDGIELLGEEMEVKEEKKEEKKEIKKEKKDVEMKNLERFRYSGILRQPNKIKKGDRFKFEGFTKKVEPNKLLKAERFVIYGSNKPKEEYVPVKRKGFVEKINKKEIKKKGDEKKDTSMEKKKVILYPDKNESLVIVRSYVTNKEQKIITHEFTDLRVGKKVSLILYGIPTKKTKILPVKEIRKSPAGEKEKEIIIEKIIEKNWNDCIYPDEIEEVFIKNAYDKVKIPEKQIIQKQEIKTIHKEEKPIIVFEIEHTIENQIFGIEKKPVVEKEIKKTVYEIEKKEEKPIIVFEIEHTVENPIMGLEMRPVVQKEIKKPVFEIEHKEEKPIQGLEKKEVVEQEVKTVEKIIYEQKNWNDEIKPIKSTKLFIQGEIKKPIVEKKIIEKQVVKEEEKEEYDIESFAHNFIGTGRKFNELFIENGGFDLEGNKGMILKEGPAETIKITKEQILVPTQISQFTLRPKIKKKKVETVEKAEKVEVIEEVKTWSDLIRPSRGNELTIKQKPAPKPKPVFQEQKVSKIDVIGTKEVKEVEKPKIELKAVKENKLFINGLKKKPVQQVFVEKKKEVNWNDVNKIRKEGVVKFLYSSKPSKEIKQVENGEKVKTVEKIIEKVVEVEKEIDWNRFNEIDKKDDINLLHKKKEITLAERRINSFSLIGEKKAQIVQKIEKKIEKIEKKDWKDYIQAQRNAKFTLYGKQKTKKHKLLVANGDKFFIQKESDDEIIYNDDYNSRRDKQKLKNENEGEGEKKTKIIKEKEIIREKEYVPRMKREIRAQISRLKESESDTSSISEIDVLAGIKKRKIGGYAAASGEADAAFAKYRKSGMLSGYQTKIISGEVVFTAKNGLGVNLGGTQYQKKTYSKTGYTKKLSSIEGNKMSGIEITVSPEMKNEMLFQKMTGASGAIADGNYRIIGSKKIITTDKGLSGSISCKEMKVMSDQLHSTKSEADIGKNGQPQTYRKQIIITSTTENQAQNDLNGQPHTTRIVINNRTLDNSKDPLKRIDSKNSENSKNSGGSKKIKISTNSGNNPLLKENPNSEISQQMKTGKVVFNSRLKSDNSHSSSPSGNEGNKAITSRQDYEVRIKSNGNQGHEQIVTERKKVEVKRYKNGKKTKNVEPLRDFDSQNSF